MTEPKNRNMSNATGGSQADGHLSTSYLMKRLVKDSVKPYAKWIFLAVLCMLVMSGATALSAWLMEPVVNDIFAAKNRDLLWPIGGAVLVTFMVKGLANYGQSVLMSRVGFRILADTQMRLFSHLAHMDLTFFHTNQKGNLISRITNDVGTIRGAVSNILVGFGKDLTALIGLVSVMFYQNWQLAFIAIFVFPIAILPIVRIGRRMRKVSANTQAENAQLTTLLEQTFQGMRVVKSYGMEDYEKSRAQAVIERIFNLSYKAERTRAMSSPIMETLGGAAVAVIIVYGGFQVINEQVSAGSFFSFITALLMAYDPMKRLANLNSHLQQGLAGAQRLFAMLDVEPTIKEKEGAVDLVAKEGAVEFNHVTFTYENADAQALDDISLTVPAGKTIALVGPSGAGKSTILNLIPRFYDVNKGAVKIDGVDVRDVTLASLQTATALVSQEITLFDDTIRANIAYGRAGATEDEIIAAAKNAAAHDFIQDLPDGYDTVVGEQGVNLSGGQRQRLAIARAMLKNAPILLLDEATSALDTESERKVQAALKDLMKGRTTLVIAHRLSTVVDADLINVIDKGKLVESGSHTDLLAKDGQYAKLYALQFAEEEKKSGMANGEPVGV